MSYLFDNGERDDSSGDGKKDAADTGDNAGTTESSEDEQTDTGSEKQKKKKKKRKGIDDEDPVSFRTATGPITIQQGVYYALRDMVYAMGPMFAYIMITVVCVIVGYPLTGMARGTFAEYLAERSNPLLALGVLLTFRHLFKKSKKNGSAFFEDASLYLKKASLKKILMGFLFGMGAALFLSAVLTLIPKVWVFANYDTQVQKIYKRYDIILTIIESAVLTPLVEEIIFRGYMLNRLLRRWPDLPALIVTTAVFSVMHGTSVWILYAFAMGWVIGNISVKEGNILYGIFIHAGFNMPSVVVWFYYFIHPERQGTGTVNDLFETALMGLIGFAVAALMTVLYRRLKEKEVIL